MASIEIKRLRIPANFTTERQANCNPWIPLAATQANAAVKALSPIKDELDLVAWEDAKREFDADPRTLSSNEVAAKYF